MMTQREALEILAAQRGDPVVISTMGSSGIWPTLSDTPLDFAYIPSSMGQGIALGLGLAIAQPTKQVIVLMGDGSLLMNLGSLVTVASHPANLRIVLLDNGLYEITGDSSRPDREKSTSPVWRVSAGIKRVHRFTEPTDWKASVSEVLGDGGPVFVWLKVTGEYGKKTPAPPRPMGEQIARLQAALRTSG